jgi:hypothetical protein
MGLVNCFGELLFQPGHRPLASMDSTENGIVSDATFLLLSSPFSWSFSLQAFFVVRFG